MSLPRYQKYEETLALGLLPAHWQTKPLKWVSSINDEALPESTPPDYQLEYVDIGSVSLGEGIEKTEYLAFKDAPSRARRIVRDGDVLVSTVRTYLKAIAPIESPPENMIASTGFAVVRPSHGYVSEFLKYSLQSERFVDEVIARSTGVSYPAINASDLGRIYVPAPPVKEQTAIATFLDRETAKIDVLIAEQEKLVALLAEKRQATISHAVTKGLNPNAPMKDSGVAWLGEVAGHWLVGKAGFYISVLPGYAFPSTGFSLDENNIKLLRGINVGVGELRWDEVVYWPRAEDDGLEAFELHEGDVVIGMDRPLISTGMRVAAVKGLDLPCLLLQRVAKIQAGPSIDSRFVMRLLCSRAFEAHFAPDTTGVSVPHISGEQILNFVIPVPPLDEQQRICEFIESELAKLDALNYESKRAIALLKERRSALISAVVTGKIDVRQS